MRRTFPLLILLSLATVTAAGAVVRSEVVEYRQGDAVLQGWVSYDDAVKGPRPAVLVVHDWKGATEHQKGIAERLAELGYVALACDVYGKGVRPTTSQEARTEAMKYYRDPALFRARTRAGLDFLAARPQADAARLAAIGYCFGGAGVLELARSGAPLKAVVSFHGSLGTVDSTGAKDIRGKVLVLHGADDPNVGPAEVQGFIEEMRRGGVDYQLVEYGGAVHSFTDPRAGNDNSKGAAYNAAADRRSWAAMRAFFNEVFER